MSVNDLSWRIGGPQGSGVDSAANVFQSAVAEGGLHVYGKREYHSNIMGLHSYFQVRVSEDPIATHVDSVDLLACIDEETVERHKDTVVPDGGILYDPEPEPNVQVTRGDIDRDDVRHYPIPALELIEEVQEEFGIEDLSRLIIMKNTIFVGASFEILGYDPGILDDMLRRRFAGKSEQIAEMNVWAAGKAREYVRENFDDDFPHTLSRVETDEERVLLQGIQAVAMAKLSAGCRFQTYYPISPATDESEYLESHPEYGMTVMQGEDELSCITMALGAAIAGTRAATSTAGPGYSLMVEATGYAGMTETPVVITYYQRGSPSTGLPTRTEQGDLLFALHASHGEFPRILLAPGDLEECFTDTVDAFNYAERYQTPAFILADKHLASTTQTLPPFDLSDVTIDRGLLLTEEEIRQRAKVSADGGEEDDYKRYELTETGISPRTVPGQEGGIFWMTGSEHDEYGHVSEESDNRIAMMEKRMRKLDVAEEEIPMERRYSTYGPEEADVSILSWGSSKGSLLEGMELLKDRGTTANYFQIRMFSPFPELPLKEFLESAELKIGMEQNYSGQMTKYTKMMTGLDVDSKILKFNGRPISRDEVVSSVSKVMKEGDERVVLTQD